jgi:hypothetical protein
MVYDIYAEVTKKQKIKFYFIYKFINGIGHSWQTSQKAKDKNLSDL